MLHRTISKLCQKQEAYIPSVKPPYTKTIYKPRDQKPPTSNPTCNNKPNPSRYNPLNIQMLSKNIFEQVFSNKPPPEHNLVNLEECQRNLSKHNMTKKKEESLKEVDFKIPPLEGKDIEEHFRNIGTKQLRPYLTLIETLLKKIPKPPDRWEMNGGWTRYAPGQEPQPVPYPQEEALVFDVEVCMSVGKAPTLATAVSSEAWYGWVSPSLTDGTSKPVSKHHYSLQQLIPLESTESQSGVRLNNHQKKPKIVVGHNVSYDRARIKEQYWLKPTGTRFVDTMSLHVCVSGITSYQRAILKSGKDDEEDVWRNCSSLNSLDEVHKLYCGTKISKTTRDLFVEGNLDDIKEEFQKVMKYCSDDVSATYNVLKKLFPLFLQRFPHPVTLAGMLELSTAYLPINSNWNWYIENSDQTYEDLDIERRVLLQTRANQACHLLHDEKYKQDLWLWDLDWSVKNLKLKNVVEFDRIKPPIELEDPLEKKFFYLYEMGSLVSKVNRLLPGYPNWYRKLCTRPDHAEWVPGPHLISTSMQVTPKLLKLTWEGYPLHYIRNKGWGFLVPFTDDLDATAKLPLKQLLEKCPLLVQKPNYSKGDDALANISQLVQDSLMKKEYYSKLKKDKSDGSYKGSGVWCDVEVENCCFFIKLPHKNGQSCNVGNPLARDFLNKFSENVLAGDTESAESVLSITRQLSYWHNNRSRISDQMIVWLPDNSLPKQLRESGCQCGAIIPQVVVCGTLTRRAVEPTWMTASNAQKDRVGSELRSMVQAPSGYNLVGADVDSQELWIASVIGDAHFAKMHGATPFGWMTLSGTKADGTDMHSVTAKAVGISRDHAKVINYARIYGAGQNFAEQLLKQFNPSISETEARAKASKMFALTKGKRVFFLKDEYLDNLPNQVYTKRQAFELAKSFGKKVDEMFVNGRWVEGTESAMFNRLEDIANSEQPCTPFLNSHLSRALEPKTDNDDKFLPTRVNWVVQSGAVDFLHLMLVCMRWIMGEKARFCLSFHDEVRYLVPEEFKYQAALAMHVTNLLTRSFCSARLGIFDLPQSVAFFSSVEVDSVLRKDGKDDCKTPSNPHGLEKGYNIKNGEVLDVYEAIEKAGGRERKWYLQLKK